MTATKRSKKQIVLDELLKAYAGRMMPRAQYTVIHQNVRYAIEGGWVPSNQLANIAGYRYSARLWDIRRDARIPWDFESKSLDVTHLDKDGVEHRTPTGVWLYRLKPSVKKGDSSK